jgi:hypothetical protein
MKRYLIKGMQHPLLRLRIELRTPDNPHSIMMKRTVAAALLALGLSIVSSDAHDRRFVYSYETIGMPKGLWEYEQWMTWKSFANKDRFDFRHEFEYGISDTLTIDIYLADWRYESFDNGEDEADYRRSGFALRQQLTDPNKSFLGSALYGEVLVGDEMVVLEGKILLQKNFGPLIAVYNGVIEAEWEGGSLSNLDEQVGVWENIVGLSYQVNPNFFLGVEALHEVEFADWSDAGDHVVSVGPNVSFRKGNFFATAACLFETTGVEGEAETQLRLIAGFSF